jgi:signal peptidase II
MKRKLKIVLPVLLLVFIDQAIKIYISNNWMNKEFDILGRILGFKPYINASFSWINSLGEFGINLLTHIIVNVIVLLFLFVVYGFISEMYVANKAVNYTFALMIAGGICSLIDKAAWGGSLDYVWLKGFFIFDLKDLYLSSSVALIVLSMLLNYKWFKEMDDKIIFQELMRYIKGKMIKK